MIVSYLRVSSTSYLIRFRSMLTFTILFLNYSISCSLIFSYSWDFWLDSKPIPLLSIGCICWEINLSKSIVHFSNSRLIKLDFLSCSCWDLMSTSYSKVFLISSFSLSFDRSISLFCFFAIFLRISLSSKAPTSSASRSTTTSHWIQLPWELFHFFHHLILHHHLLMSHFIF